MLRVNIWASVGALLVLTGNANATLVERGNGMVYDTSRNLTWLADMNYALSSGYAAAHSGGAGSHRVQGNGRMGWEAARTWANSLVYGGFDDWRLPSLNSDDTSCSLVINPGVPLQLQYYGYNCSGGELSGLFGTSLGNKAQESVVIQAGDTSEQIANLAMFRNVQSANYWSDTPYAPVAGYAWYYSGAAGLQSLAGTGNGMYALVVRSGDVPSSVPEPQTAALSAIALGAALWIARRKVT